MIKMEELFWYKFTERNDNEGETWHFFVLLTKQERDHIEDIIDAGDLEDFYSISTKTYREESIDILVEESDEGYMPTYNKRGRPSGDVMSLTPEEAEEEFYKGYFW